MLENPLQHFLREHTNQEPPLSLAEEELLVGKLKKEFLDPINNDRPELWQFADAKDSKGKRVYSELEIKRDEKEVQKLKKIFFREKHDRAILTEGLLYYLVSKQHFLGTNMDMIPATYYDDFKNQVDMILEITDEKKPCWIAVDATVAENPEIVRGKKQAILDKLTQGHLTKVKYFQSEPHYKGRIALPEIVLDLSHEELKKISAMLVAPKNDDSVTKKLRERLMREARSQLTEGIKLLANAKNGEFSKQLLDEYRAALQSISLNS